MDPQRFLEAMQTSIELDHRMSNAWVWCEENECFPVLECQRSEDRTELFWTVCGRFESETPLLAAEAAMAEGNCHVNAGLDKVKA